MKKIVSLFLALCLMASFAPFAFAHTGDGETVSVPVNNSEILERVTGLYDTGSVPDVDPMATGLIKRSDLSLSKTSAQLIISAITEADVSVTKCGFTYIKLQRLLSGSWTDYSEYCYYDQYNNTKIKEFTKTISAPKGYTYRVICEHYAEKPRLAIFTSSEKIYNETTSLYF